MDLCKASAPSYQMESKARVMQKDAMFSCSDNEDDEMDEGEVIASVKKSPEPFVVSL